MPTSLQNPAPLPVAVVSDAACRDHRTGSGHPERPERYDAVLAGLNDPRLAGRLLHLSPRHAEDADVLLCHTPAYVNLVKAAVAADLPQLPTGDTPLSGRSLDVAREAVGCVLTAVDAVLDGPTRNAFCVVRPPGHHAGPSKGEGFCVFNNIAIGARHAQRRHGVERVLIVDFDVHHGNGTQDVFYADDSVLFFSTHQSPLWPYTGAADERGEGRGVGHTINCPLPADSGGDAAVRAFTEHLLPAAERFRPQLVMISAGFDARAGDPLGGLRWTDDDFATLTRLCLRIAADHAGGRVVSVLEGGYNLAGLTAATAAHVAALCELES